MKLSVIVLSYNRIDNVKQYVPINFDRIKNLSDFEFLIVDNGSSKKYELSKEFIDKYNIQIIRFDTNLNVPVARNKAIEAASGDYIMMLDDDIELSSNLNWSEIELFLSDGGVGAIFPKKIDHFTDTDSYYEYSIFKEGITGNLKKCRLPNKNKKIEFGCMTYIANKQAILLSRYDEEFGFNFRGERGYAFREESTLHKRMRNIGLSLFYYDGFEIIHHIGVSKSDNGKKLYWIVYGNMKFIAKYSKCGVLKRFLFFPICLGHIYVTGIKHFVAGLRGYIDGWRE